MTDLTLAELIRENEKLRKTALEPAVPGNKATMFVVAVVLMSIVGLFSIVAIFVIRPDQDNSGLITIILGFLLPLVTALLGGALQQVHLAVNSRLSQLLVLTAKASEAEGQLTAKQDAADHIQAVDVINQPLTVVTEKKQ